MATLGKEEVLDAIANMTVMEVSELVKAMEEKFGVTAAAPMVAAAVVGAGGDGGEAEEEQTEFTVILKSFADSSCSSSDSSSDSSSTFFENFDRALLSLSFKKPNIFTRYLHP